LRISNSQSGRVATKGAVETLPWEDGSAPLITRFLLVQPRVHAVFGEAGVKGTDGVAVRAPQGDDVGDGRGNALPKNIGTI
jgi:hypothetical protein